MEPTPQPFCPYKGLAPFEEDDYAYFFGRDRETRLIVANLFASRMTLLYGPSGVGKSSVLRAGALHELRSSEDALVIPPFASWHRSPLPALKRWIADAASVEWPAPPASLTLAATIRTLCAQTDRRVMIVLDQFEEYFLYNQLGDGFGEELAGAVLADTDFGFVISLRDDALARLDAFEGLIPNLFDNFLRIEHLSRSEARDAIVKPLARYNETCRDEESRWSIEPALVEGLLDEVGGGVYLSESARAAASVRETDSTGDRIETPYLQLVVTKLWDEELNKQSRTLRLETYNRLGGAEQIVRSHVEDVLNTRLTADERQMASQIFNYLVTPSRTKIAHSATDLASYAGVQPAPMKTMLTKLVGGRDRILRTVANPNAPAEERFEIFHDRLAAAILEWRGRYLRESIAASPDASSPQTTVGARPEEGIALCLSGGGYRSMLFQTGVLWRLNEARMLPQLDAIGVVSAGGIVGCVLGSRWGHLTFNADGTATNFVEQIVTRIRALADTTVDLPSFIQGLWGGSGRWGRAFAAAVGDGKLADLPGRPNIFVNLVNLATGTRIKFEASSHPDVALADVVVASSAPPSLTDVRLPAHNDIALSDGSSLDRLGTEAVWRRYATILVSDGASGVWAEREVPTDMARRTLRVFDLMDYGSRTIAKRQVIDAFRNRDRKGGYWSLGSRLENFAQRAFDVPPSLTDEFGKIPVRLAKLDSPTQESLINWGYVMADAGLRTHVRPNLEVPGELPYATQASAYTRRTLKS